MIGVAGDVTLNIRDTFTELLLVDVLRGHHSTGAAAVKRFSDDIVVGKAPMPSPMFINTKEYKDVIDAVSTKVLIGHNRYATVGERNASNAHPFQFDTLVGAHNGTLDTWALNRLDDAKYFGTDSEALYNSVDKHGIKETIEQLSGAWALTWYDKKNKTINLLRNAKRPLFYAYDDMRTRLFWASESDMLDWILTRNKIKIYEKTIYSCDPDRHYRWVVPEKLNEKFDKPVLAEVKERTFPSVRGFSWEEDGENWYNREVYESRHGSSSNVTPVHINPIGTTPILGVSKPAVVTPPAQNATKIDTKKFRPPYKDAYGAIIKRPQFEELVAGCCVFCDQADSKWGDFIYPLKDDLDGRKLYLCKECYDDDDVRLLIANAI